MDLHRKRKIDYVVGGAALLLLKPLVIALGRVLKRDHRFDFRGDVLVLKLLGGGSLVLASSGLRSLKRGLPPGRKLILVTTPPLVPFAAELALFDEILTIDDKSVLSLVTGAIRFVFRTF